MNIKAQKNKYYPESFTSLSFGDQLLADQSFAGFLLSIRIWLIRLTIVTLLAVSAWAFFYEERVFTVASFELGWLLRILAVLPILFTFKYKSFYPLSNPWVVRFLGLGILTLSAFWLNYAQIHATPHLPLVLTLLVVILDEPLSKSIFYRYFGSSCAYFLMIWLFGFVYDELWSNDFENTKTLFLSSGSIVITVSFVLHYAAFFHKRLADKFTQGIDNQAKLRKILELKQVFPKYFLFWMAVNFIVSYTYITLQANNFGEEITFFSTQVHLGLCFVLGIFLLLNRNIPYFLQVLLFIIVSGTVLYVIVNTSQLFGFYNLSAYIIYFLPHKLKTRSYLCLLLTFFLMPALINVDYRHWVIILSGSLTVAFVINRFAILKEKQLVLMSSLVKNSNWINPLSTSLTDFKAPALRVLYSAAFIVIIFFIAFFNISQNKAVERNSQILLSEINNEIIHELDFLYKELNYYSFQDETLTNLYNDHYCYFSNENSLRIAELNTQQYCESIHTSILSKSIGSSQTLLLIPEQNTYFLVLSKSNQDQKWFLATPLEDWFKAVIQLHNFVDDFDLLLMPRESFFQHQSSIENNYSQVFIKDITYRNGLLPFVLVIAEKKHVYFWRYYISASFTAVILILVGFVSNSIRRYQKFLELKYDLNETEQQLMQIEHLSSDLQVALNDAQKANTSKTKFLAVVGHEIRTPLNSVIGFLTAQSNHPMSEKVKSLNQLAIFSANSLLRLVNDILDFARLDGKQFSLYKRPFSFNHFIDQLDQNSKLLSQNKGLTFELTSNLPDNLVVSSDEVRLHQVLSNLISNAIKFSEKGVVGLDINVNLNAQICNAEIRVWDTGRGIPEEDLEKIFDPFIQVQMSDIRDGRGAGLGLSIVKELVELLGGTIEVVSKVGSGSAFTVKLPLPVHIVDLSQVDGNEAIDPSNLSFEGMKVLVVDDDKLNLMVIEELLGPLEVEVDKAATAQDCLVKIKENRYHFVLMDHQMPHLTGSELTRLIRKEHDTFTLPIIGLTADLSDSVKQDMLSSGMNACFAKPIKFASLVGLLKAYSRED